MNDRLYLMPKQTKEVVALLNARAQAIIARSAPKVPVTEPAVAIHAFLGWVK